MQVIETTVIAPFYLHNSQVIRNNSCDHIFNCKLAPHGRVVKRNSMSRAEKEERPLDLLLRNASLSKLVFGRSDRNELQLSAIYLWKLALIDFFE